MPCCLMGGYQPPEKVAVLGYLAAAGVGIPDGATIWGPGAGWAWRLVDRRGQPLGVASRVPLKTLAAAGGVDLKTGPDGWIHVHPERIESTDSD